MMKRDLGVLVDHRLDKKKKTYSAKLQLLKIDIIKDKTYPFLY